MNYLSPYFETAMSQILAEINHDYFDISAGGCVFFARQLGKVLLSLGFDVRFVILCDTESGLKDVDVLISTNTAHHIFEGFNEMQHCMVKIGDYLIDNHGIITNINQHYVKIYRHMVISNSMSLEAIDALASRKYKHKWNMRFDQEQLIPIGVRLREIRQLNLN